MAMKPCKECGAEISKTARECPHCGKQQINFFVLFILYFVIFAAIFYAVYYFSYIGLVDLYTNENYGITGTNQSTTVTEKFTVLEHKTENDGYWTYITGIIKNNTNKEYSYVTVEINLYDENGSLINSALDTISNLEANGTWKFKAMATSDFATYKIKEVTGF